MPPKSSVRKSTKRTRFSRMEVVSINDYDRLQRLRSDSILNSAIDQLEALADPDLRISMDTGLANQFGRLDLGDDLPTFLFTFEPPQPCRSWPGPSFGLHSLHKALESSIPTRKHRQPDDFKPSVRPGKIQRPAKIVKPRKADVPTSSSTVASRTPALKLTTLPPEVRNIIWSILAVREDPIEAQFRRIQPCKRLSRSRKKMIRRYPLEPVVAAVNHQLRAEVLSIFYGCNRFILEKNAIKMFKEFDMTKAAMIQKWSPPRDVAKYLTSLEIRFAALPRGFGAMSVIYNLRRPSSGKFTAGVKAARWCGKKLIDVEGYCLCKDEAHVEWLNAVDQSRDLADMAVMLVRQRTCAKLDAVDERSELQDCGACGREHLESVE